MQQPSRMMYAAILAITATTAMGVAGVLWASPPAETDGAAEQPAPSASSRPLSIEEARGRAALLHDAIDSTLDIVHHQYYREDEGLAIPAFTLKRVFAELARRHEVELSWIAVNAQAMNVDHIPDDEFEKEAVKALAAGKPSYEQAAEGTYRRAAPIKLTSDCLKCHVPSRLSTETRLAGLVITLATQPPRRP